MIPADFNDFFFAVAGAAAALIGLLFVAVSVAPERVLGPRPNAIHQLRATMALTSFVSALLLSLIALIPDTDVAWPATAVGVGGATLFATSLLRLHHEPGRDRNRVRRRAYVLLLVFLALMLFVVSCGIRLMIDHHDTGAIGGIAGAIVAMLAGGIDRSWELVGGPTTGVGALFNEFGQGRRDPGVSAEAAGSAGNQPG